jgi:hypothetical protein
LLQANKEPIFRNFLPQLFDYNFHVLSTAISRTLVEEVKLGLLVLPPAGSS